MVYAVFVRNWWRRNSRWPGGLEPDPGARKTLLRYAETESEARSIAQMYNSRHKPGPLSRKAEYTKVRIGPRGGFNWR